MTTGRFFLGVDGGGSKCKAVLVDDMGEVLGTGLAGPANPMVDMTQAQASVSLASAQALAEAGLNETQARNVIAGIGLAGVNVTECRKQVQAWPHQYKARHITTDLDIALMGAHGSEQGSVVVVGTGSCGLCYHNGETHRLGGQGFLLGDQGSGAWFGLKAIKHSLLVLDGLTEASGLSHAILHHLGNKQEAGAIVSRFAHAPSADFARFAPVVFACARQGDPVAMDVVRHGARYINALIRRIQELAPGPLAMLGGLSEILLPWLDQSLVSVMSRPKEAPEFGAVAYARSCEWEQ